MVVVDGWWEKMYSYGRNTGVVGPPPPFSRYGAVIQPAIILPAATYADKDTTRCAVMRFPFLPVTCLPPSRPTY